jgi:hypothetical protein
MTTIDIHYQKRKNLDLFQTLESVNFLHLSNTQNYIPIYNRFFSLNETNYNNINLNNKWYLYSVKNRNKENKNLFKCLIKNDTTHEVKQNDIFIKLAPLIDPFKYLVGKYDLNDARIFQLPNLTSNEKSCCSKFLDMNNSAYVDGFFIYLLSSLKDNFNFKHGINYYGSFLSIKNDFTLNVFDDLDYLNNSEFFNKNKNILFKIDEYEHLINNEYDNKTQLKPLKIHNSEKNVLNLSIKSISDDIFENIFTDEKFNENPNFKEDENLEQLIFDINENIINDGKTTTIKSNSTCSSRTSYTDNENDNEFTDENNDCDDCHDCDECDDCDESWEDFNSEKKTSNSSEEDEEYEEDGEDEEEEIFATIPKIPVQVICMENCEDTFDNLIMNNELSNDEWFAYLMQIIMMLLTYQKTFLFTHNDLHTNNVMYNKTTKKFITYRFNNNVYKVPTFGKLFKIIDFGRSIYKFQGKVFCSDSFKHGNDAAGQYNTEPYFNENKSRLEPNFSFDLCRLACSIFDYIINLEELKELRDKPIISDPLKQLLLEWCLDDNGINVLYKINGDERYPDFKLYKMIARHVHKHTPILQLERPEFKKFLIDNHLEKSLNNNNNNNDIFIDIDKIPFLY